MTPMFRFLDHPSETLVEVSGATMEEVFRDSALALFEVMTDTSVIRLAERFPISVAAENRASLLIDWLNRLILIHEVEHVFLAHFKIAIKPGWKLEALAGGERIRENQEKRSHVKSATFGSFEWMENTQGHTVRFVLDV